MQASRALDWMREATEKHFELERRLPIEPDFNEQFVNNGRWRLLHEDYGRVRIPYYHAWAVHHAAMAGTKLPPQELADAVIALRRAAAVANLPVAARRNVDALRARLMLRQAESLEGAARHALATEAADALKSVLQEDARPPVDQVTTAWALTQALEQSGHADEAIKQADRIAEGEQVKSSAFLQIIAYDRCVALRSSETHSTVLRRFLSELDPTQRPAVERFLVDRELDRRAADQPVSGEKDSAPLVMLVARVMAGDAVADQAAAKEAAEHDKLRLEQRASERLAMASQWLTQLSERAARPEADPAHIGSEEHDAATDILAQVRMAQGNPRAAITLWLDLAMRTTDLEFAERAARNGYVTLTKMIHAHPSDATLSREGREVRDRLIPRFAGRDLAARHLYVDRASDRLQRQEVEGAITDLTQVPQRLAAEENPVYLDAQYLLVLARFAQWGSAELGAEREKAGQVFEDMAKKTRPLLEADHKNAASRRQLGDVLLLLAERWMDTGRMAEVAHLLEGFEQRFEAEEQLLADKRRLELRVQLDRAPLEEILVRLDQADVNTLIQILQTLDQRAEGARLAEAQARRDQHEEQAENWALRIARDTQISIQTLQRLMALDPDPAHKLAIEIQLGNRLNRAGRHDKARELFDRLNEAQPDHPEVLVGLGDARQGLGELKPALDLYLRVRRGLGDPRINPKPMVFWRAGLGQLTIYDQHHEQTAGQDGHKAQQWRKAILREIQRNLMIDRNMGGPDLKKSFDAIRCKHENAAPTSMLPPQCVPVA